MRSQNKKPKRDVKPSFQNENLNHSVCQISAYNETQGHSTTTWTKFNPTLTPPEDSPPKEKMLRVGTLSDIKLFNPILVSRDN